MVRHRLAGDAGAGRDPQSRPRRRRCGKPPAGRWTSRASWDFVILHRCSAEFYFLLVCSWRHENEIWKSTFARDGGDPDFKEFTFATPHRGTYCVWELGAVWHEQQAWKRYLRSAAGRCGEAGLSRRQLPRRGVAARLMLDRVMPALLLGRHVVEAASTMLQEVARIPDTPLSYAASRDAPDMGHARLSRRHFVEHCRRWMAGTSARP